MRIMQGTRIFGIFGMALALAGACATASAQGVVINEFMADNDTIASPAGVKADWIELYNNGGTSVSLAGMHLSDNPNNPTKWTFPAGVTIAAGGYLVVWAYDTTVSGSALFAGWALSKDGEHIRLSNADLSVVDSVTFGPQPKNRTTARIPNGTGPFVGDRLPTLGSNNGTGAGIMGAGFAAGAADLALAGATARVRLAEAGPVTLSLLDARGREVAVLLRTRLEAGEHAVALDPARLPAGAYALRLRAAGTEVVRHAVVVK